MSRPLAPHVQAALARAAQPKSPAPPAGVRAPAPHVQAVLQHATAPPARSAPPAAPLQPKLAAPVLRRPSTIQRMEGYTTTSSSKESGGNNNNNNNNAGWSFVGRAGEKLTIVDTGKRLNAYIDGEYVGYLSYEVEVDEGVPRMRFGYISIEKKKHRNKKLSSVLIFLLALRALQRNIGIICVGHPDPELKDYWEKIGFDFGPAQKKQHLHILSLYSNRPSEEIPTVDSVTVTEATAATVEVLHWAQQSYNGYWHG